MAANSTQVSEFKLDNSQYKEFKTDVLSKLEWKFSDWALAQQENSDLHFLVKNINYWFRNLEQVQHDRYIVLTTYFPGSKSKPSLLQISRAFKAQFGVSGFCGISASANKNFVILHINSDALKKKVLAEFCMIDQFFIITSDWITTSKLTDFAVNWLPSDVPLDLVQEELEKYSSVLSINKQCLDLGDGDTVVTGNFSGTLGEVSLPILESFPHILTINGFRAHWIIYARSPLCLSCRKVGHMAVGCPTPFCTRCRALMLRGHVCKGAKSVLSYAKVAAPFDYIQAAAANAGFGDPEALVHNVLSGDNAQLVKDPNFAPQSSFVNPNIDLVPYAVTPVSPLFAAVMQVDASPDSVSGASVDTHMDFQSASIKRSFSQITKNSALGLSSQLTYSKKNPVGVKSESTDKTFDAVFS